MVKDVHVTIGELLRPNANSTEIHMFGIYRMFINHTGICVLILIYYMLTPVNFTIKRIPLVKLE